MSFCILVPPISSSIPPSFDARGRRRRTDTTWGGGLARPAPDPSWSNQRIQRMTPPRCTYRLGASTMAETAARHVHTISPCSRLARRMASATRAGYPTATLLFTTPGNGTRQWLTGRNSCESAYRLDTDTRLLSSGQICNRAAPSHPREWFADSSPRPVSLPHPRARKRRGIAAPVTQKSEPGWVLRPEGKKGALPTRCQTPDICTRDGSSLAWPLVSALPACRLRPSLYTHLFFDSWLFSLQSVSNLILELFNVCCIIC